MGLVRLMRAGSMHYCAVAMRQLPDDREASEEPQPFAAAAQQLPEQPPSDAHLAAAHTLDDALAQLRAHASAGPLLMKFQICTFGEVVVCSPHQSLRLAEAWEESF